MPLVVSYGMGVDSTAMLVGMHQRGIRPDMIIFADVGSEKPETYEYRPVIEAWLANVGFPALTVIRYQPKRFKRGEYSTIEGNCTVNRTLPSLAFGRKACSSKWKGEPIDREVRRVFASHVKSGGIVERAVGYDAGPCDMKRGGVQARGPWSWVYPLREWGWDRERCIVEIKSAGLPVPPKSACFFCPSTKPAELIQLGLRSPELARRAVEMEDRARPSLRKITGLWGRGVKGVRKGTERRPGSWRTFFEEQGMLEVLPPEPAP